MPTVIKEYTEVIKNLHDAERSTFGKERRVLGSVAGGIGRFLRKQPWRDAAERRDGLALAEQAEAVQRKCLTSLRPEGVP